jgi:uracil-DNA glycosylase family 4
LNGSVEQEWQQLAEEISSCRKCPRLVAWREEVARLRKRAYREQEYWGKPITGFGDQEARVLVVGLAPGAHGANRTGRVFTGDGSGDFLFRALHKAGFANHAETVHKDDGLALRDMYITAVCRCAPPGNKPLPGEIAACQSYLEAEFLLLKNVQGIVVLGKIAFDQTLRLMRNRGAAIPALEFSHLAHFPLGDGLPWLLASYHPSRQNTQTGRLTEAMFDAVWQRVKELLG